VNAHYLVKSKAAVDLDAQAAYISAEADIEVALRFLAAARATFALLATHPNMGWCSRLLHVALRSLRVFRVTGFEHMLILYRPLSEGVEILRVVHGSRNLKALFRRRAELED